MLPTTPLDTAAPPADGRQGGPPSAKTSASLAAARLGDGVAYQSSTVLRLQSSFASSRPCGDSSAKKSSRVPSHASPSGDEPGEQPASSQASNSCTSAFTKASPPTASTLLTRIARPCPSACTPGNNSTRSSSGPPPLPVLPSSLTAADGKSSMERRPEMTLRPSTSNLLAIATETFLRLVTRMSKPGVSNNSPGACLTRS
mmetsp:Transcript_142120/g.370359  ORF Transcript_142120/g.370359 Transcript_142120/m.370359 type:complete len:201 (+) Transcript_142120:268-870(+)